MQDPRKHLYSCSCVKTNIRENATSKPLDLEQRLILYTWLGQRLWTILCATFLIVEIFQGSGYKYGRYLRVRLNTFLLQVSKPWPESEHLHRPTEQNNLILSKRLHFLLRLEPPYKGQDSALASELEGWNMGQKKSSSFMSEVNSLKRS